jgi:hypothetical protein
MTPVPRNAMTERQPIRRIPFVVVVAAALLGLATPAAAQLDPLLFLKTTKPNVLLIVDTSQRMLYDAEGNYYDPWIYSTGNSWDSGLDNPLGLSALDTRYRRKYVALSFLNGGGDKWSASAIKAVGNSSATAYANFYAPTRIEIAKAAMLQAVRENATSVRFGQLKTRQASPSLLSSLNERPVFVSDAAQQEPTDDNSTTGRWKITRPTVGGNNHSQSAPTSPNFALVKADVATANTDIVTTLGKSFTAAGALLPAGNDAFNVVDSPVANMLSDAKSEAARLIAADTACRNTIAVLVVGGGEGTGYAVSTSAATLALQFKNISSRRVPIYVVAIAPAASEVADLRTIAENSGGQFFEITQAQIDAAVTAGVTVPEVVNAINTAVQHAFAKPSDVNTAPTATQPYGPQTTYQTASPIVGTVNLKGLVPASEWEDVKSAAGVQLPQRSNVVVTAGFALPGFDGHVRGFRVYKPVADSTKVAGYKFVADGTLLWTATTPGESQRNIFTALPNGTMMSFTTANAGTLAPYLNTTLDVSGLITQIRSQPIGAVVSSTPAVLDAPSLDPPPDQDYPAFLEENEDRRSLVIFGANDGMLHAVDARTGLEVWAYIPFNLLPKLKTLRDGQPIDSLGYFVDSSPKVADVKVGPVGAEEWRTYLIIGEGAGGTFYQAFDITLEGMSSCIDQDNDTTSTLLGCFSSASRIPLKWSFPDYSHFDYTYSSTSMPFGDLNSSATAVEKTVGQTWSDPAVGQIYSEDGPFAVLTGSGFFPYTAEQTNLVRKNANAEAGRTLYILDAQTGAVLDSKDVGDDNKGENVDDCSTATPKGCTEIKNAIQADPVATGAQDSRFITKVFVGDLDGKVWRFTLGLDGSDKPAIQSTTNLYAAGSADHPLFSSMAAVTVGTQQYLFFGTGSDLLPSTGVNGSYKLVGLPEGSAASFSISLTKTDGLADDEKVTAFPAVAGDIVFFTTTNFKPATPCSQPDANLYALTFIGGAAYASSNDADDKMGKNESPKVKTLAGAGRATAPFIVDQHLWFGAGDKIESFGDPEDFNNGVGQIGVRILSWRQIR